MQINFAHLRERATNGGEINFAVLRPAQIPITTQQGLPFLQASP